MAVNDGRIAFTSTRDGQWGVRPGPNVFVIYVMDADGRNQTPLTNTQNGSIGQSATFSPDGSKIAFHGPGGPGGLGQVWVMGADGQNQIALADGDEPAFSPDGTSIAFVRSLWSAAQESHVTQIWVMDADGSNQRPLTGEARRHSRPRFSPDGSKIAFGCRPLGEEAESIYLMGADGQNQTCLIDAAGYPAFAPDGTEVAFLRNGDIWVVDVDGRNASPITTGGKAGRGLAYSPDGTRIVFASTRDRPSHYPLMYAGYEIYVMDADGRNELRLTDTEGHDFEPAWGPKLRITIDAVSASVTRLALPAGLERSLLAKLEEAARRVAVGDVAGACASLASLVAHVTAQSEKKIGADAAVRLTAEIHAVRQSIGCV